VAGDFKPVFVKMYILVVTRREFERQTDQNEKFFLISVLLKVQERQK